MTVKVSTIDVRQRIGDVLKRLAQMRRFFARRQGQRFS